MEEIIVGSLVKLKDEPKNRHYYRVMEIRDGIVRLYRFQKSASQDFKTTLDKIFLYIEKN